MGVIGRRGAQGPAADNFGARLRLLRRTNGMSRSRLARSSGLSRRTIASVERNRTILTEEDRVALAGACGVDLEVLTSTTPDLSLALAASPGDDTEPLEALLREYVMMVLELREAGEAAPSSIRQEDLTELARGSAALPRSSRRELMELLHTDEEHAWQARTAILPSYGVPHSSST